MPADTPDFATTYGNRRQVVCQTSIFGAFCLAEGEEGGDDRNHGARSFIAMGKLHTHFMSVLHLLFHHDERKPFQKADSNMDETIVRLR